MIISYREYKPSDMLLPYIENYFVQIFDGDSNEESPLQKCLPLGMAQIIVHTYRQDCVAYFNEEWLRLPDAFFVGIYKDAVTWKTRGYSVCFGITLKPESLMHLFKVPASTLFNNYTDISSFLNKRVANLAEQMYGINDPVKLIGLSEEFLLNRLKSVTAERSYVDEASRLIRHAKGNISIDTLCKKLYVSERQLQRSFKEMLGTSPKTYTRIIRFRNVYQQIKQTERNKISWTDISYDFGYADQAHFIRDFKEFTGAVPTLVTQDDSQFYQMSGGDYGKKTGTVAI